ncbi:MAG TPA: asparaginase [Bdellovibrionota bacterium]|jgi:L-asparaginase|nr:asparaginase [Bdellovibrionota bacterium]
MSRRAKLLLIHTGGTIGMNLDGEPDPKNAFTSQLEKYCPSLFDLADVHVEILLNKDSSNMAPADWVAMSETLDRHRNNYDGFLVTHGTDTMAFSATALSFMLRGFNKPVIFTGAQRPLLDPRSDGPRNLVHSAQIAIENQIKEVGIFFDSYVFRGNRARKVSAMSFGAFSSPNYPPLAHVGVKVDYSRYLEIPAAAYRLRTELDAGVFSFSIFPGMEVTGLKSFLSGYKAVVIQAFGPGDVPTENSDLLSLIRDLAKDGIQVIITSQSNSGEVDLSLYEAGRAARAAGALTSLDMTWESAVIKSMHLLGQELDSAEFKKQFTENLCGELSVDLP